MWRWDQGRIAYYQFDALKAISKFVCQHDFKLAQREVLLAETGLPFKPNTYNPWRNYSRTLKQSLLVSEEKGVAVPTPVAKLLAKAGIVTSDEYVHFLLQAFTDPSPAFKDWKLVDSPRYPLLFSLKYLLAKVASKTSSSATLDEIIAAYIKSNFIGDESEQEFIILTGKDIDASFVKKIPSIRQARESLKVMCQISYLHCEKSTISVSLEAEDAKEIFQDLAPIGGEREVNSNAEIRRLANFFKEGSTQDFFDFTHTTISEVVDSGFKEGSKIKKTHIVIERNSKLREMFFKKHPVTHCDLCLVDTAKKYPWTEKVLDVHHLLPLSSGTKTEDKGTALSDLIAVCPTCHRAIHRYYDQWLKTKKQLDFNSEKEALLVYKKLKKDFCEGKIG
jgi:hypothetical protein